MVYFCNTESVQSALREACSRCASASPHDVSVFEVYFKPPEADRPKGVSLAILKRAVQLLNHQSPSTHKEHWYLHKVLQGSGLYIPPKVETPKSPEAQAKLDELRRQHEERVYAQMVSNVTFAERQERERDPISSYNVQLGSGVDMLLAMFAMFVFGYMIAFSWSNDNFTRMIGGVIGLILGMLVEGVLLIARIYNADIFSSAATRGQKTTKVNTLTQTANSRASS